MQAPAKGTEPRRPREMPVPRPAPQMAVATSHSPDPGAADLRAAVRANQALQDSGRAPYSSVRAAVKQWEELTSDETIIKVIKNGVDIPLVRIPQPLDLPPRGELGPLVSITNESVLAGAVQPLPKVKARRTSHWIPMSVVRKKGSGKWRLISQFNQLNTCFDAPRFKPDSWKTVQELLQDPTLTHGATLDMANWFHHLALSNKARRWARCKVQGRAYEMTALPFGLSSSPYWAHRLSKPILEWARAQRLTLVWYVDDVLILGSSAEEVERAVLLLVNKLTSLGVHLNAAKCHLTPSQQVEYLGQSLDLKNRRFIPLPSKLAAALRAAKKALKGNSATPKHLAGVAGKLLDLTKSLQSLHGIPKTLMRIAASLVAHNKTKMPNAHVTRLWGTSAPKPPELRKFLILALDALQNPVHVVMSVCAHAPRLHMHVDASKTGWGASLTQDSKELAFAAEWWPSTLEGAHSTHLEARAPLEGLLAMRAHIPPGCLLTLHSDCSSVVWGVRKGSSKQHMTDPLRKFTVALASQGTQLMVLHVPGKDNVRADLLSRTPDQHHYCLRQDVYNDLCGRYDYHCQIDLFANVRNSKCKKFYSERWSRHSAGTNAFAHPWKGRAWLNPPWHLAHQALRKLDREQGSALTLLPYWPRAPWWPLLLEMQASTMTHLTGKLYSDPQGKQLPPPRWRSVCLVTRGRGTPIGP